MKPHTYIYETTYEPTGDGDPVECRILYTYSPGCDDWYDRPIGGPGGWQPGDPPELEIQNIHVEVTTLDGGTRWFDAGREQFDAIQTWAETSLFDDLARHASETMQDEREAAAEHAADCRREMEA